MESKMPDLGQKIDDLCSKVEKRMRELGDMDIMTYRSDPILKELRKEICDLYRKAVNMCGTYGEALKVCEIFQKEPTCVAQLMLSEELICPLPPEET